MKSDISYCHPVRLWLLALIMLLTLAGCQTEPLIEKESMTQTEKQSKGFVDSADPTRQVIPVTSQAETTGMPSSEATDITVTPEPVTDAPTQAVTEAPTEAPEPVEEYVVVLDPGHGGVYYGAVYDGRNEKDLALKVGLGIRDYLESHYRGVTVYMTRETDTQLSLVEKEDLENRVIFAAEKQADVLVSLHFNSEVTHQSVGAYVLTSKQAWVSERADALGYSILNELAALGIVNNGLMKRDSTTYFDDSGIAMDYYAIPRHASARNLVGVIVEHCFMDNATDIQFLNTDEKLTDLAVADARGIAAWLGLEAK